MKTPNLPDPLGPLNKDAPHPDTVIELDFSKLTTWGEDELERVKRALYEWGKNNPVEVNNIVENWREVFTEEHLRSLIILMFTEPQGLQYSSLQNLVNRVEMNSRNVILYGESLIRIKSQQPSQDIEEIQDMVDDWEDKWRRGKNPFSKRLFHKDWKYIFLEIDPRGKFSFYQLDDLVEDLPSTKGVFVKTTRYDI